MASASMAIGSFDWRSALRSWLGIVIVIILMSLAFYLLQPRFMTLGNWQNIVIQGSALLVISIAGTFPIVIGSIDLSVASISSLTGVLLALVLRDQSGWMHNLAVPIAVLAGCACGVFNGALVALMRVPSFLATLGTFFMLDGLAAFIISGIPVPIQIQDPTVNVFDGYIGPLPNMFIWAFLVLVVAFVVVKYTRFGRHLYAIGGSEPAARVAGVNVVFVKLATFVVSGALAAFSGVLLSVHALSGSSGQSAGLLLPSIGAIVIGGTSLSGGGGGPHHTLLGVLLIVILINGMQLLAINSFLQLIIVGMVVIVAVVLSRPNASIFSAVK